MYSRKALFSKENQRLLGKGRFQSSFLRVQVQRIRAKILLMRPGHGSPCHERLTEISRVAEFLKYAKIKERTVLVIACAKSF
jgi:hypothetical protein